jgi:hypothetical protein
VVSRYDAQIFCIEFVVTYPGYHVEKVNINLISNADGSTGVYCRHIYTALTSTGIEYIKQLAGKQLMKK